MPETFCEFPGPALIPAGAWKAAMNSARKPSGFRSMACLQAPRASKSFRVRSDRGTGSPVPSAVERLTKYFAGSSLFVAASLRIRAMSCKQCILLCLLLLPHLISGAEAPKKPTMAEVLAKSKAADWRTPEPENTLYLELERGRVVVELAPDFAPNHV